MSQTLPAFDFTEHQRVAGALLASAIFSPGTQAMLAAQEAMFVKGESMLMAWMNRRHEAILDAQRLFARMRECRDLSEAMQAQQDWIGGALRRLSDDAAGCRQAAQMLVEAAMPDGPEAGGTGHADLLRRPANDGKPAATAQRGATARAG